MNCATKLALFWLVILIGVHRLSARETNAAIPYQILNEMFQPTTTINQTNLDVHIRFFSTNKTAHPSDIRLVIHSATKGIIPVTLDTNGQLVTFPADSELSHENPPVVANQPPRAMRYAIVCQIPPSDGLSFPYRRLANGVDEMNKAMKAQAGIVMSFLVPKVDTVIFFFPKNSAGTATVKIDAAAGRQEFTADKYGIVKLQLEKALLAENPLVTVSEKPEIITVPLPQQ